MTSFKSVQSILTSQDKEKVDADLKIARSLNSLTKAVPTQNIRDIYRARCGFAPCIVHQRDTITFEDQDALLRYYPSFEELMKEMSTKANEPFQFNTVSIQNESNFLVPGDIAAVNPGTEDGIHP